MFLYFFAIIRTDKLWTALKLDRIVNGVLFIFLSSFFFFFEYVKKQYFFIYAPQPEGAFRWEN